MPIRDTEKKKSNSPNNANMEAKEHLVTINAFLYESDNLHTVHTISKFDKYDYDSQVETNTLS